MTEDLRIVAQPRLIPFVARFNPEGGMSREPVVAFYDARWADRFGEPGQFVAEYYAETLMSHPVGRGLDLHGGVPDWTIDAEAFDQVRAWLALALMDVERAYLVTVPLRVKAESPEAAVSHVLDLLRRGEILHLLHGEVEDAIELDEKNGDES